jgi:hypothetical protein
LLIASAVDGELPTSLILIFWPLFEPILEGHPLMGTTVRHSPLSILTCGRWLHQALFAAEVLALPPNIQNYTVIQDELYDRRMGDDRHLRQHYEDALLILFGLGTGFRLLALICISKLKCGRHTIASTKACCVTRASIVARESMRCCTIHAQPQRRCPRRYLDSWCSPFPMAWRVVQRVLFLLFDTGSVDEGVDPDAAKAEVELAYARRPRSRPSGKSRVFWDGQQVRILERANTMSYRHQQFLDNGADEKRVTLAMTDRTYAKSASD